ncbi:GNAT family N-acetyltransferase [Neobacillus mesonae]|uniref:GNAT family N-acetyltransferase n=1 Tax=Neobacillus mesonae TaxID=1193713 RepID=UPI00203DA189|nr:GNAT family N-acetyltransferase [Neobacillus mesonae]MCM3567777.1 GNAT family N-acetyltransferase [Neobacillus mesonae]
MEVKTISEWDENFWREAAPIYEQAFAGKGAKPEKIIRNMFRSGICFLHIGYAGDQAAVMAITGKLNSIHALLIDYLAVHSDYQSQGMGKEMVRHIKEWAAGMVDGIVIEVESDQTSENLARKQFWLKCGFHLTDYIHQYIWVPEPYQAMYLELASNTNIPKDGKQLFKQIGKFHEASFKKV